MGPTLGQIAFIRIAINVKYALSTSMVHRQTDQSTRSWAAAKQVTGAGAVVRSSQSRGLTSVGGSSSVARTAHSGTGGRRRRPETGGGVRMTCC